MKVCIHKFGMNPQRCERCGWDAINQADPNGPDTFTPRATEALAALDDLSDDERLDVISRYCKYCGSKDPRCQCANDE